MEASGQICVEIIPTQTELLVVRHLGRAYKSIEFSVSAVVVCAAAAKKRKENMQLNKLEFVKCKPNAAKSFVYNCQTTSKMQTRTEIIMKKNWEIFSRVQQICEIFRHLNKNENCFDFMETNCTCLKLTFLFIFFQ